MGLRRAEEGIRTLLYRRIVAVCRATLKEQPGLGQLSLEGLLGVTLNQEEIFLVAINETIYNKVRQSVGRGPPVQAMRVDVTIEKPERAKRKSNPVSYKADSDKDYHPLDNDDTKRDDEEVACKKSKSNHCLADSDWLPDAKNYNQHSTKTRGSPNLSRQMSAPPEVVLHSSKSENLIITTNFDDSARSDTLNGVVNKDSYMDVAEKLRKLGEQLNGLQATKNMDSSAVDFPNMTAQSEQSAISFSNVKFRCYTCGKDFKSKTGCVDHMAMVHGVIPTRFKCEHCGLEYQSKTQYATHILYKHKQMKPFQCKEPGCGKTYCFNKDLKGHMASVHNKGVMEQCPECGKLVRPGGLKVHLRVHGKVKNFMCAVCGQTFRTKHNMVRHMKLKHSLENTAKPETVSQP